MPKPTFAIALAAGLLFCAASTGRAEEPVTGAAPTQDVAPPSAKPDETQPAPPTRFTFNRVENGFLRLDNKSGTVTFCSAHSVGWACQAVPEDRAALEKEIARLQDEVTGLKQEVASLREPPPPRPPAELSPPVGKSDDAAKLREDMERARAALENAWHRLVDMIVNFQKDMMRKGELIPERPAAVSAVMAGT